MVANPQVSTNGSIVLLHRDHHRHGNTCDNGSLEQPSALGQQMICYSWLTGIERVALVVFVRKRLPEIQYQKARISEEQRQEYGRLVGESVRQIEAAQFLQHSGIRFP
jgi:hypothetical protein